jgi:predicted nicotinamide N-methyase
MVRCPVARFVPADVEVLDLPQLYTKPSAHQLMGALTSLKLSMPSWDVEEVTSKSQTFVRSQNDELDNRGLSAYLTSIIASSLNWIESDDLREDIWQQASARLSERSGRSGMSALDRSFQIPSPSGTMEITLHEPALTADNLGLKTWAASYLLAKRLLSLDLPDIFRHGNIYALELGSGTGLVGIAAAAILGANVCLTDLPEIKPNLKQNVKSNINHITLNHGKAITGVLDWSDPSEILFEGESKSSGHSTVESIRNRSDFPLILAADSIYSSDHPRMLAETMKRWLSKIPAARIVVELPLRPRYDTEIESFRENMKVCGFSLLREEEEAGYDDWESSSPGEVNNALVRCWFSIWGWSSIPLESEQM